MAERKISLEYLKEAVMEPVNFWGMAGFAVAAAYTVPIAVPRPGGQKSVGQVFQPAFVGQTFLSADP